MDPAAIEDHALCVLMTQASAAKRGALTIWTIYDRPADYPHGYIARRHEAPGGPTDHTLIGDLDGLREIFLAAGFTNIRRQPDDEPPIVESWV